MKLSRRTIYFIVGVLLFFFLFGNAGFRTMVRRYWEINKLKLEIEQLQKRNGLLKREVYFLESDSSYIEKAVRKELGLIAAGEVEYRFKE